MISQVCDGIGIIPQTKNGPASSVKSYLLLVDLGEERVGRLRDNGSADTGNQTGAEVDRGQCAVGQLLLGRAHAGKDLLGDHLIHHKLGHGVRNLLEEDYVGKVAKFQYHAAATDAQTCDILGPKPE